MLYEVITFVPFGADLQLAFPNPLGIQSDNAFDFKLMLDLELLQSDPDREQFVPSLGIEPDLAAQVIDGLGFDPHNFFPVCEVGHEHAVAFSRPSLGTVSPIRTGQVVITSYSIHYTKLYERPM